MSADPWRKGQLETKITNACDARVDVCGLGVSQQGRQRHASAVRGVVFELFFLLLPMPPDTPPWKRARPSWRMGRPRVGSPVNQVARPWQVDRGRSRACSPLGREVQKGHETQSDSDAAVPSSLARALGGESSRGRRDVPRLRARARGSQSQAFQIATR